MFLFWSFGMIVVRGDQAIFIPWISDIVFKSPFIFSSSPPTCNLLAASFVVFVTSYLDYCNSLLIGSLSLSFTPLLFFIKKNLITKHSCFKDLLSVPHGPVVTLLSKAHKALHRLNPIFLFCFYQSTHIIYLLVILVLFAIS